MNVECKVKMIESKRDTSYRLLEYGFPCVRISLSLIQWANLLINHIQDQYWKG
jgi:hypothetical protein